MSRAAPVAKAAPNARSETMIKITYNLSESARRAELAAGRSAERRRTVEAQPSEYLAAAAELRGADGEIDTTWARHAGEANPGVEAGEILTAETAEQHVRTWSAQVAELRANYEARQAERSEREAQRAVDAARQAAERELKELERKRKCDEFQAACRGYVIERMPEFERAVREGCDVSSVAARHVLGLVDATLVTVTAYDDDRRDCPSDVAFNCLDNVRAFVSTMLPPASIVADCELTIVRADLSPLRNERDYHTCVKAQITWGDGTTTLRYVFAEKGDPPTYDDDEE
jgi:hypothetical protein